MMCMSVLARHVWPVYVCLSGSVGLSSTTSPSLGVAIPVPAQAHLYTHAKGRAT